MGADAGKAHDVVRPLGGAGSRACVRPGCPALAHATLTFLYETREARLSDVGPDRPEGGYDLCSRHADRTRPPRGWDLHDDRRRAPQERDLDGPTTVAILAAALGRAPDDHPATGTRPTDAAGSAPPQDQPASVPGRPVPAARGHRHGGDDAGGEADRDTGDRVGGRRGGRPGGDAAG